jgi:hypothetical protein
MWALIADATDRLDNVGVAHQPGSLFLRRPRVAGHAHGYGYGYGYDEHNLTEANNPLEHYDADRDDRPVPRGSGSEPHPDQPQGRRTDLRRRGQW